MTTAAAIAAGSVLRQLTDACARVSPAGPADVVGGRAARYVAAPASTAEAAAVLRAAAGLSLTVVARGAGTKLDWGAAPASCDLIIDTRLLDQVLEHAAGDLVVSVQAGILLADLAKVVSMAGQRLALDPPDGGTIGGILATQAAGPLRFRYGAPRDLLIGITVVRADGTIARSGGKVVKNVAGYDLGKLFAGSYGTLGLIAEATFRLHPAPAAAAVIAVDCGDALAAAAAVDAMARSPLAPSAVELKWPSAAAPIIVSVLLEGDEASVGGRADRMVGLLGQRATVDRQPGLRATVDRWSAQPKRADHRLGRPALPADEPKQPSTTNSTTSLSSTTGPGSSTSPGPTVLRVGFWAGQLASVLTAIRTAALAENLDPVVSGSAAAGVLHVEVADDEPGEAVARFVAGLRAGLAGGSGGGGVLPAAASAVVVRAPADVRAAVDVWGPVPSLGLMRAVKEQFDAESRMAPGRFAGGI
ncbi:MAG: FAD-binding oxidoreductase [Streptosporangiaceae bacterium]